MKADALYEKVTNQIIEAIEAGAGDWAMPWHRLQRPPISAKSGKPYNGVNQLILGIEAMDRQFSSSVWGTYRTWEDLGAQVRRGERATHVFLWKPAKRKAKTPDESDHEYLLARTFAVFNQDQVDGGPPREELPQLAQHERIEAAEGYFAAVGANVREGGDRAYYAPAADHIAVPLLAQFANVEHYYTTLAHEHVHWTGHETRLNRNLRGRFGDSAYAAEELVAELGAAFFAAQMGLDQATRKDHSAYLASWLEILRADSRAIVSASSQASKAIVFLNKAAGWAPAEPRALEAAA